MLISQHLSKILAYLNSREGMSEREQTTGLRAVAPLIECGERRKKGSRDADRNHSPAGGVCWTDDFSGITPGLPQATPIGFGLHNMTERFGIAGPLSGQSVSWKF